MGSSQYLDPAGHNSALSKDPTRGEEAVREAFCAVFGDEVVEVQMVRRAATLRKFIAERDKVCERVCVRVCVTGWPGLSNAAGCYFFFGYFFVCLWWVRLVTVMLQQIILTDRLVC